MKSSDYRRLEKRARKDLEEFRFVLRKARKLRKKEPELLLTAVEKRDALKSALKTGDYWSIHYARRDLADYLRTSLPRYRPRPVLETLKAFAIALAVALLIRWALIEPFQIPSGSMIPTLLVGDQLLVNKIDFGLTFYVPYLDPDMDDKDFLKNVRLHGAFPVFPRTVFGHRVYWAGHKLWMPDLPERGEVVVFQFPDNPSEDYIKRVIGLPGDTVQVRDGKLFINGMPQSKKRITAYTGPVSHAVCDNYDLFREELMNANGPHEHLLVHCRDNVYRSMYTDYGPKEVPEGHVFVMGDNRDHSYDSRSWGMVPLVNLKGSAMFIHLPLDPDEHYLPRWDRFFKWIH
ncbi:MAG: signal peptidase I [bacterium]